MSSQIPQWHLLKQTSLVMFDHDPHHDISAPAKPSTPQTTLTQWGLHPPSPTPIIHISPQTKQLLTFIPKATHYPPKHEFQSHFNILNQPSFFLFKLLMLSWCLNWLKDNFFFGTVSWERSFHDGNTFLKKCYNARQDAWISLPLLRSTLRSTWELTCVESSRSWASGDDSRKKKLLTFILLPDLT